MSAGAKLLPAVQGLCQLLTAAGVAASTDRNTMRIPGAWVRPDRMDGPVNLAGDYSARVSVLLVVPVQGEGEALADLGRLLDKTLAAGVTPDEPVDTSVLLTVRNNAHPAFRLQVDLDL